MWFHTTDNVRYTLTKSTLDLIGEKGSYSPQKKKKKNFLDDCLLYVNKYKPISRL